MRCPGPPEPPAGPPVPPARLRGGGGGGGWASCGPGRDVTGAGAGAGAPERDCAAPPHCQDARLSRRAEAAAAAATAEGARRAEVSARQGLAAAGRRPLGAGCGRGAAAAAAGRAGGEPVVDSRALRLRPPLCAAAQGVSAPPLRSRCRGRLRAAGFCAAVDGRSPPAPRPASAAETEEDAAPKEPPLLPREGGAARSPGPGSAPSTAEGGERRLLLRVPRLLGPWSGP